MIKVSNWNTSQWRRSGVCSLNIFNTFYSISIVDFKQINVRWFRLFTTYISWSYWLQFVMPKAIAMNLSSIIMTYFHRQKNIISFLNITLLLKKMELAPKMALIPWQKTTHPDNIFTNSVFRHVYRQILAWTFFTSNTKKEHYHDSLVKMNSDYPWNAFLFSV